MLVKKRFLNWNCFQVKVHFVDFGNTEVISLRSIVFLSHDFLSPAPFAQLYCLYDVAVTSEELLVEVHFDLDHCFQLLNILWNITKLVFFIWVLVSTRTWIYAVYVLWKRAKWNPGMLLLFYHMLSAKLISPSLQIKCES